VRDKTSLPPAGERGTHERVELCLDFTNTLDWHASDHPKETLHRYEDFLEWAGARGVISRQQIDALARRARRKPQAAADVYGRATALREAVYRIFVARIAGKLPAHNDVRVLNGELQRALSRYRVEFGVDGPEWCLAAQGAEFDLPLWPIVQSAAELLLSEYLRDRVGQCADPAGCGWLFLDLSKNRSRRWCSIRDCGNRAKQRRLQARLKPPSRKRERGGFQTR
jgi:predicted RNA-binding Zn ribbon-like protein